MFDRNRIKEDFSRAADHYDDHAHLQQQVLRGLLERAKPLLAPHMRILDAGCGTGMLARLIERKNAVQLDISHPMCCKALKNGNATVNGALELLPFADASFDAAFSSLVLQWLPDWRAGMQELRRVVKPNGLIAVSTLGESTLCELRWSFAEHDAYPHVSPFITPDATWEKEVMIEYFPDLRSLMRTLKAVGAGNKLLSRRKSMMTPEKLERIEAFYRRNFGSGGGLSATWEILYKVG